MICESCGKESLNRFCNRKCANNYSRNFIKKDLKQTNCKTCNSIILIKQRANSLNCLCENCKKLTRKKINTCKFCKSKDVLPKKSICENCRKNYYKNYRFSSEFNFDINLYNDFFKKELQLVKKYGWYSPTNKGNNLKGISKDHMFSVNDGFKFNIHPIIISHPANCKLLIHLNNQKKKTKSSITLMELFNRIILFEQKIKSSDYASLIVEIKKYNFINDGVPNIDSGISLQN